jgi:hypothetical protein
MVETVQVKVKGYHSWMKNFAQQQELVKVLKFRWFFRRAAQLEKSNKGSKPKNT